MEINASGVGKQDQYQGNLSKTSTNSLLVKIETKSNPSGLTRRPMATKIIGAVSIDPSSRQDIRE